MQKIIISLIIFLASGYIVGCSSSAAEHTPIERTIAHQVDSLLSHDPVFESISIGAISPEVEIKLFRGKLLNGEQPDDNTLFEIASITKTFTGLLLSHALEENKIALMDSINGVSPKN
ncbi:MAG: serine hydrolase [Mameliella sp.]|nr:serine hydrolase [Phaeodactylibacter sp.]